MQGCAWRARACGGGEFPDSPSALTTPHKWTRYVWATADLNTPSKQRQLPLLHTTYRLPPTANPPSSDSRPIAIPTMATLEAKVKSVLSGDTVVLHNVNNPKQERTLSLAFVTAPRLKREGDEPFAFDSRDFLRRLLVGKVVHFRVLYKIPTGANREYGIISLPNKTQLPDLAVADGWVKLRDDAGRKDDSDESSAVLEKLQMLEARAKADSKGLWQESPSRINSTSEVSDPKQLVDDNKGKDINGAQLCGQLAHDLANWVSNR